MMIKVKKLSGDAGYNSFGAQYECRIGKADVLKLVGQLPNMGYRLDVKKGLHVANVCGSYFLRTCQETIDRWEDVYGVKVI
jgi:hypothetical protein